MDVCVCDCDIFNERLERALLEPLLLPLPLPPCLNEHLDITRIQLTSKPSLPHSRLLLDTDMSPTDHLHGFAHPFTHSHAHSHTHDATRSAGYP